MNRRCRPQLCLQSSTRFFCENNKLRICIFHKSYVRKVITFHSIQLFMVLLRLILAELYKTGTLSWGIFPLEIFWKTQKKPTQHSWNVYYRTKTGSCVVKQFITTLKGPTATAEKWISPNLPFHPFFRLQAHGIQVFIFFLNIRYFFYDEAFSNRIFHKFYKKISILSSQFFL